MADNVQVAIKVRPLLNKEQKENLTNLWTIKENLIYPSEYPEQQFFFDHIFGCEVPTSDIFEKIAKPIVDSAVNGINGTLFAYGQTASGKTYTMMGTKEEPGVIILSIFHVFDKIEKITGRQFLLRVSYLEIYNEKLQDLLTNDSRDIKIREDVNGIVIQCREEVTNTPHKMLELMRIGNKNRRIGETNMNERSSRSHTIFRIIIESTDLGQDSEDQTVQVSHLNLVDLAGSERANQTFATGVRLKEGCHINKSLLALSLVIKNLSEGADNKTFINYRGSKLTRLLQNSLGGNAMTGIICAVTPVAFDETISTLHFASAAKKIKNKPQVNEVLSDTTMLKRMEVQIIKLKKELEKEKTNVSTRDNINRSLKERIKKLTETILQSGTALNNTSLKSISNNTRRRTWCPSSNTDNLSPLLTAMKENISGNTPFEDFELNIFAEDQHNNEITSVKILPVENKIYSPRFSNRLSDISEFDSRMSMESCQDQVDLEVQSNELNSLSKNKRNSVEQIIQTDDYFPFTSDNLYQLNLTAIREEEIQELKAREEFLNDEVNTLIDEVKKAKIIENKYEELVKETVQKENVIRSLCTENDQLKLDLSNADTKYKVLQSVHNDYVFQTEHLNNKFKLREQELLNILEEANSKNTNDFGCELKILEDKFNKEKDELYFKSQMQKEELEGRIQELLDLVKFQENKITELESLAEINTKVKLELIFEQNKVIELTESFDVKIKNLTLENDALINKFQDAETKLKEQEKILLEHSKKIDLSQKEILDLQNIIQNLELKKSELESLVESNALIIDKNDLEISSIMTEMSKIKGEKDDEIKKVLLDKTALEYELEKTSLALTECQQIITEMKSSLEEKCNLIQSRDSDIRELKSALDFNTNCLEKIKSDNLNLLKFNEDNEILLKTSISEKESLLLDLKAAKSLIEDKDKVINEFDKLVNIEKNKSEEIVSKLEKLISELNTDKNILLQEIEKKNKLILEMQEAKKPSFMNVLDEKEDPKLSIYLKQTAKSTEKMLENDSQISNLESLISLAKTKYSEIANLLDNFYKSDENAIILQKKIKEIQSLNKNFKEACEILRNELNLCSNEKELITRFSYRTSVFEESLQLNNKHFSDLCVGLRNPPANEFNDRSKHNILFESDCSDDIQKENSLLRHQVEYYKNIIIIFQNELQNLTEMLLDLKAVLKLSKPDKLSCTIEEAFDERDECSQVDFTFDFDQTENMIDTLTNKSVNTPKNKSSQMYSTPRRFSDTFMLQRGNKQETINQSFITPVRENNNAKIPQHLCIESDLSSTNKGLKSELRKVKSKYFEIQEELEKNKLKNSELEDNLLTITKTNDELIRKIKHLENEIELLVSNNDQIDELKLDNAELESEINKLFEINSQMSNELKQIKGENVLREKCNTSLLKNDPEAHEIECNCMNHEKNVISELKAEYKLLTEKHNNLKTKMEEMEELSNIKILEYETMIQQLEDKVQNLLKENNKLSCNIKELHGDMEHATKQKYDLEERISQMNEETNKLQAELNAILTEKLDAENALEVAVLGFSSKTIIESPMEEEFKDLQNQIDILNTIVSEKEALLQELSLEREELNKKNEFLVCNFNELKNKMSDFVAMAEYNILLEKNSELCKKLDDMTHNDKINAEIISTMKSDLELLQQEKLESLNAVTAMEAECLKLKSSISEIDIMKNRLFKEIKGFVQGDLKFIENLSLVELHDLMLKYIMEKQLELSKKLEQKYMSKNADAIQCTKLQKQYDTLENEFKTQKNSIEYLSKQNNEIKSQYEISNNKYQCLCEEYEYYKKIALEKELEIKDISKNYFDTDKLYKEIKNKYDSLLAEHTFFKETNKLYEEIKIKYENLLEEHGFCKEISEKQLNADKLFAEMQSKYDLLFVEHSACKEISDKYFDIDNLYKEIKIKHDTLLNEHKLCKEISVKHNNLDELYKEIKSKYDSLVSEHSSCEEIIEKHFNIGKSYDEIKVKYDELTNEHKLCRELSEKYINLDKLFKENKSKYDLLVSEHGSCKEMIEKYFNIEESYKEVKTKYDSLLDEHNFCTEIYEKYTHLDKLFTEMKSKYDSLLEEHISCKEINESYEDTDKLFKEMKSKYDLLLNEHSSCEEMSQKYLEVCNLNKEIKSNYDSLLEEHNACGEISDKHANLTKLFKEIKSNYDSLSNEHSFCKEISAKYVDTDKLYKEIKIKYDLLLDEHNSCKDLSEKCLVAEKSTNEIKMKYDSLFNVHNLCKTKTDEILDLSNKLKITNEKLVQQNLKLQQELNNLNNEMLGLSKELQLARETNMKLESEISVQMKLYHQLKLSFETVENKYLILLNEHKLCKDQENELLQISDKLKKCKEIELNHKQDIQKKEKLINDLQTENSTLTSKLTKIENAKISESNTKNSNVQDNTLENLKSLNSRLNNECKMLYLKNQDLKKEFIKASKSTVNIELRNNLENVTAEKNKLSKQLQEEQERIEVFLKEYIWQIKKITDFKPRPKIIPWTVKAKEDYYSTFEEKFKVLIKQFEEGNTRLAGMDKLISECDRLKSEISLLNIEIQNANDLKMKNQYLLRELDNLKLELKNITEQLDKARRTIMELEGASNFAMEAKKKIMEHNENVLALEKELEGVKEAYNSTLKQCESLTVHLKESKSYNLQNVHDKTKALENIMILKNLISEKDKQLEKLQAKNYELSNKKNVPDLNARHCVCIEKCVQTETQEEDVNVFKEKYLRYRKVASLRLKEINELKSQLGCRTQNVENSLS